MRGVVIRIAVDEVGLAFVKVSADPGRARNVPPEWISLVVQNDHLGRRKQPEALTP